MSLFTQLMEAVTACRRPDVRTARTAADPPMEPEEALRLLKDGNRRFVAGRPVANQMSAAAIQELVDLGQAPHTAILAGADSRVPLDTIFDTMPGDIFALRNVGNTCTHAEGSMVGSLEFCTGKLGTRLVLVLGHTKCGAVYGATKSFLKAIASPKQASSALEGLLQDLGAVAQQAQDELGPGADCEAIAAHAVRVNVLHTMNFLLKFSEGIREGVRSGQIEIHGGIYHLETGCVEFLGQSPEQAELLESSLPIPPSMVCADRQESDRGLHGVRTGADATVHADEALKLLKEGNERFAAGAPTALTTNKNMRRALAKCGQSPHSAILGPADSRVPVDTVFDTMPGELFVLRNAGNTSTHAEGSIVGSLEFCTGKLGTRLVLVLGHTQCGAVAGATRSYLSSSTPQAPGTALEGLLQGLAGVAKQASEQLGPAADEAKVVAHAVKVNIFHSMNFLLKFSEPLRQLVIKGELEIQGGIYNLETGRVQFLGRSPQQAEMLASKRCVPRCLEAVRTCRGGPMQPQEALTMLRDGNERFAVGAPMARKVHDSMREALAIVVGQAPHTAVLASSDARVPIETLFDACPGDLFVLRNAGNSCTSKEGTAVGSLEYCTGKLGTKLVLVLGHTNCGVLRDATKAFLNSKKSVVAKEDGLGLQKLLRSFSSVVESAAAELGPKATECEITKLAIKLNVFQTVNFLLQHSEPIRQKVMNGDLEIQGGIYDVASGRVEFLGKSPAQSKLLQSPVPILPSLKDKLQGA